MLKHLYISNFTLIEKLNISFNPGFSTITGETGAGKSIIIGALSMLLGNRADTKMIKAGKEKCIVEATFSISDFDHEFIDGFLADNDLDNGGTECVLRREINVSGKNRSFINDTPVVLSCLKELGEHLIDIHSQHQNLMLNKEDFQLNVIDVFANNGELLCNYKNIYKQYKAERDKLDELLSSIDKIKQNQDFLAFQDKELSDASLESGEQERLEQQSDTLTHAEEIKGTLYRADDILSNDERNIIMLLKDLASSFDEVGTVYPDAKAFAERISNCMIELKDVSHDIASQVDDIDYDPNKLQQINQRLDTLYSLQKKYHVDTVEQLIECHADIRSQLMRIDNFDNEVADLQKSVDSLRAECERRAVALTKSRVAAAASIEKELAERLVPLGIPNVRFKIRISSQQEFTNKGVDKVTYLFSSNASSALNPIAQVASGGEISRVMLSLKAMMSRVTGLPTIIFDEIDTGVSGRVAEQMALIMAQMGDDKHQVLCITHLPQIAALGSTHYKVSKTDTAEGANSVMHVLSDDERVSEIAQMLSGSDVSQAAIDNAKSLLRIN